MQDMSELMDKKKSPLKNQWFYLNHSLLRRLVVQRKSQMSEIDPREFGKLEAQVEALQTEVHALRQDIKTLLEMANKSKGGFFVGMAIASVVGGIISFIATKVIR
jgi:ABC-type Zn uptake system ZnuABC Zn-binding protein ZnuA